MKQIEIVFKKIELLITFILLVGVQNSAFGQNRQPLHKYVLNEVGEIKTNLTQTAARRECQDLGMKLPSMIQLVKYNQMMGGGFEWASGHKTIDQDWRNDWGQELSYDPSTYRQASSPFHIHGKPSYIWWSSTVSNRSDFDFEYKGKPRKGHYNVTSKYAINGSNGWIWKEIIDSRDEDKDADEASAFCLPRDFFPESDRK